MNKTVKWILISLGGLILLIVLIKVFSGGGETGTKVTIETVAARTITETVTASGRIYPEIEVKVSSDVSGEIVDLNVEEGDSVKRGQVLARIYADIYSAQRDEAAARVNQAQAGVANSQAALKALEANLAQARQAYERNRRLYEQKVISRAEFEQFEANYRTAEANYNAALQNIRSLQAGVESARTGLEQANKNLGRATIIAPMDGVISLLNVKEGERVVGTAQMAGTEMMRVADMKTMEVRVEVGENDVVKVGVGDSADVMVDAYNNRTFRGVVTQIAASTTTAGQQTATTDVTNYEVRIRIDPASYADLIDPSRPKQFPFRPGMNARADIKTERKDNVIAVPITAVAARAKGSDKSIADVRKEEEKMKEEDETATAVVDTDELEEVVFVLKEDGTVEKTTVTTGIQDINYIEIKSGLKAGVRVVTGPYNAISQSLKTGQKVREVSKDELFGE